MNKIYSKVFIARFKRSSARPAGCPVAFWIEASALGLDRNVPHTFVRALRLEIVGRHTQNFRGVATVKVGFRIGSTTLVRLEKQGDHRIHLRWRDFRCLDFRPRLLGFARGCLGAARFAGPSLAQFFCRHGGFHLESGAFSDPNGTRNSEQHATGTPSDH